MNFPTKLARAIVPAVVVLAAPAAAKDSADLAKLKAHIAGVHTMTADFVQTDSRGRSAAGTMQLKRPGKVRFQYGSGDLLIIANSLAYALYLVLGRSVVLRTDPLVMTTWVITFGAVMVLPFGAADAAGALAHLSLTAWLGIAWIVLAATVGTYGLNAWALARAPSSLVATYIYVQPVVGAALAAAFLGERPDWTTYAGGALIAAGIWIVTVRRTGA